MISQKMIVERTPDPRMLKSQLQATLRSFRKLKHYNFNNLKDQVWNVQLQNTINWFGNNVWSKILNHIRKNFHQKLWFCINILTNMYNN